MSGERLKMNVRAVNTLAMEIRRRIRRVRVA